MLKLGDIVEGNLRLVKVVALPCVSRLPSTVPKNIKGK
jgi:hypothetical protein